jgi:hypothetical protein
MNVRRLFIGLSLLCLLVGLIFLAFAPGGFMNPATTGWEFGTDGNLHALDTSRLGPQIGAGLLIAAIFGFIVVWSLKRPPGP